MYPINVQQMFEPKDGTRSKINGTRSKMCKTPFTGALSPVNGGFAAVKVSRVGVRVSFGTRTNLHCDVGWGGVHAMHAPRALQITCVRKSMLHRFDDFGPTPTPFKPLSNQAFDYAGAFLLAAR